MTNNHLVRKTALITGASSGIGRALAENFAADNYDVVLVARSVEKMQSHATVLQQKHGVTATVIGADLETADGAAKLYEDVKTKASRSTYS